MHGDSAYLIRPWMKRPSIKEFATLSQLKLDTEMTSFHIVVEQNYRELKQTWTSQDYAPNLKVRLTSIGLLNKASTVLYNFHTCLYRGEQTEESFGLSLPCFISYK